MPSDDDPQRRQEIRLRVLAESSQAFAEATTSVAQLLRLVAQRCAELLGDGCYIRLVGEDGVSLEPVATYHPDAEVERFLREINDPVPLRVGEGISGLVVETGVPAVLPHITLEQFKAMTKAAFLPIFERVGITSMVAVRLRARATNLGFIALVRHGSGRPSYNDDDLQLLTDLAERAALAIDNARLLDSLERRVGERTAELEAANAELESFSYSVSHDLRAPLRAIDGFSRVLQEDHGPALNEEGHRLVAVIRRNAQRMGQLIDDLLRFSRLGRQALRFGMVEMQPLVEAVVDELRHEHPGRALDVQVGNLPPVAGDHDLLRQVWRNILGNAVKYTRDRTPAIIQITATDGADEITYAVADNGCGFDPRYTAKLFEVFQRLHQPGEFEGTGVGLALVQRIVTRHGGRVWATGAPERGATFSFALPRRGS